MAKKTEPVSPVSKGVSIRLPTELLEDIDRLATEERRSRGNMVRLLLEDALKQRKEMLDGKSRN
jgi:metal-responsive CopG/Arc/MetJ family transcriptional regulator